MRRPVKTPVLTPGTRVTLDDCEVVLCSKWLKNRAERGGEIIKAYVKDDRLVYQIKWHGVKAPEPWSYRLIKEVKNETA